MRKEAIWPAWLFVGIWLAYAVPLYIYTALTIPPMLLYAPLHILLLCPGIVFIPILKQHYSKPPKHKKVYEWITSSPGTPAYERWLRRTEYQDDYGKPPE